MGGNIQSTLPNVVGQEINEIVTSRIHKKNITCDYKFESKILGTGLSGPVRLATHKATRRRCAIKKYDKRAADDERIEFLKHEAEVYLLLDHPNVCKLFALYEDERYVWVVMEYCEGPELYRRLQQLGRYTEANTISVAKQMLAAIHYLHSHNIVHRDLKLENWLYELSDGDVTGRLKLIDFGFSQVWNPLHSKTMQTTCGSLTYVSPDVLAGDYTNACDMWAFGVTMHFLLVGMPPFFGPRETVVVSRIMKGEFSMEGPRWAAVSELGRDFVRKLLVVDPSKRMTSEQALQHPWLQVTPAVERPLGPSVLTSLRQFAVASHLKKAVLTMMAYSLTTKDLGELADLFKQFDRNCDGCISLSDFMNVMKSNYAISNSEVEELFRAAATLKTYDSQHKPGDASEKELEICYSDFVAATLQTRLELHSTAAKTVFQQLDADGSGYVTADDLQAVLGKEFQGASSADLIKSADKNGDGKIGEVEDVVERVRTAPRQETISGPVPQMEGRASTISFLGDKGVPQTPSTEPGSGPPPLSDDRRSVLMRRFLAVVESQQQNAQAEASRRIMRRTQSVPHVVATALAGWQSPHARPWDCRYHAEEVCRALSSTLKDCSNPRSQRGSPAEDSGGGLLLRGPWVEYPSNGPVGGTKLANEGDFEASSEEHPVYGSSYDELDVDSAESYR